MADLNENVQANDPIKFDLNVTQVELESKQTQFQQNESNDSTPFESNQPQVEQHIQINDPITFDSIVTQVEHIHVNSPIAGTNKSSLEKEILQHLLSLDLPEELRVKSEQQEATNIENLDYAEEFPVMISRPVLPKIYPVEEFDDDQEIAHDSRNGKLDSEDSKVPENNNQEVTPMKQSDHDNENQETKKPAELNFAAALANKEAKKKDVRMTKVRVDKNQAILNQHKSIFISRLPLNVTLQQLIFALRKFGAVKLPSISIRQSGGQFCHAFAEFQCPQHASDAVKARKFTVGAAEAFVSFRKY